MTSKTPKLGLDLSTSQGSKFGGSRKYIGRWTESNRRYDSLSVTWANLSFFLLSSIGETCCKVSSNGLF